MVRIKPKQDVTKRKAGVFRVYHNYNFKCVCVCVYVCVCMFMWFMRTQICIMIWVWHRYYKEKVIYEDIFSVPIILNAYKSYRVSFFEGK